MTAPVSPETVCELVRDAAEAVVDALETAPGSPVRPVPPVLGTHDYLPPGALGGPSGRQSLPAATTHDDPRTPRQRILCTLFAEVLGCPASESTTTSSISAGTLCWRSGWPP